MKRLIARALLICACAASSGCFVRHAETGAMLTQDDVRRLSAKGVYTAADSIRRLEAKGDYRATRTLRRLYDLGNTVDSRPRRVVVGARYR